MPTEYSERGPVWLAVPYETTDECAPESRTAWRVQDKDDYVIAWDCDQQNAESIARSLNALAGIPDPQNAMTAAREALNMAIGWMRNFQDYNGIGKKGPLEHGIQEARAALALLKGKQG